jgi:tRNA(Ile2)-agmatinylcytidine synthase
LTLFHLGIDSTDSATQGMCTTYLGARVMEAIEIAGGVLSAPPDLVRLNPNVPWKTRGNGAVCIRFEGDEGDDDLYMSEALALTEELSVLTDPQTNPGVVLLQGRVTDQLAALYRSALHGIVELEDAMDIGMRAKAIMAGYKNSRGLIGALSAIGAEGMPEWTWETIVYRASEDKTRKRDVDLVSLQEATRACPQTFFNVSEGGEVHCIPHSPCPVLFGLRATDPFESLDAASRVRSSGAERWVLWRTNQHTDSHISPIANLKEAMPYMSVRIDGTVGEIPVYSDGGHLSFEITDAGSGRIRCWAYEPTKGFRKALSPLRSGDKVRVWGSVRPEKGRMPLSLNLEKVEVLSLAEIGREVNLPCTKCGKPTESMGRGQGLRCRSCGHRGPDLKRGHIIVPREIGIGLIEPPEAAWRHLFRPSWLVPCSVAGPLPPRYHGRGSPELTLDRVKRV